MTGPYEAWLALLVVGLAVQDGVLVLAPDEAVLERAGRGRWRARFGAAQWKLAGREILLINPFLPHRARFRLRWRMDGEPAAVPLAGRVDVPPELPRLAGFVWVAWLSLFVLLPLGLFTSAGPPLTLAAIVLLYANNVIALGLVVRWRHRLRIEGRRMAATALECLACAPYSVHLVRRVCALMPVHEDFVNAAARLLEGTALAEARAQCLARIDEQIDAEPEGSRRMAKLQASRQRFVPA